MFFMNEWMEHKTLEEISVEYDELYLIETIPFVYMRKRGFFIQLLSSMFFHVQISHLYSLLNDKEFKRRDRQRSVKKIIMLWSAFCGD